MTAWTLRPLRDDAQPQENSERPKGTWKPLRFEVPELRGVIATGDTLEDCRDQLAEVIEEWVLVRVSQGLAVPPLDDIEIKVQKAG